MQTCKKTLDCEETGLKREFPFGRERQDTIAQPFRNKRMAELSAKIMQHMTGEECDVVPRGPNLYYIVRAVGERWIRA